MKKPKKKKTRTRKNKCSACGLRKGHNARTCPDA